jgi:hypothetical protein
MPSNEKSLGKKQRLFMSLLPRLIDYIYEQGYECTVGDAYRSPRAFGGQGEQGPYGRAKSAHKNKLAIDLNLFKDGRYLDKTEDHEPIGKYWESLHMFCKWGGRFQDGNHYSMIHQGVM